MKKVIFVSLFFIGSALYAKDSELNKKTHKSFHAIKHRCYALNGNTSYQESLNDNQTEVCESNGLFATDPTNTECKIISKETKTAKHRDESVTYTEIEYSCKESEIKSSRSKVSCLGKSDGSIKGCQQNRFSLFRWKQEIDSRLEKSEFKRNSDKSDSQSDGSPK